MSAPNTYKKLVCHELSTDFSKVCKVESVAIPEPLPKQVLLRNKFVGINASDINFTNGVYQPDVKPPFDVGFEALAEVVKVGDGAKFADGINVRVGQFVSYMGYGAFAEYKIMPAPVVIPLQVPDLKPAFLPLLVSGLTATIAMDKVGEVKASDTVLVTAAAGGTGQFAVQWAKAKGCKVLGTCSTPEKMEFLKSIGCDRPINYRTENLHEVLKAECPNGVDVVYECVGGQTFNACVSNLAVNGRLVVIGMVESYKGGMSNAHKDNLEYMASVPLKLLQKSSSIRGFFLNHYTADFPEYLKKMIGMVVLKKLTSKVDLGDSTGKPFKGVDDITRAVEYMHTGKNVGKIVVDVQDEDSSSHL